LGKRGELRKGEGHEGIGREPLLTVSVCIGTRRGARKRYTTRILQNPPDPALGDRRGIQDRREEVPNPFSPDDPT
jgi:hypothetical protein